MPARAVARCGTCDVFATQVKQALSPEVGTRWIGAIPDFTGVPAHCKRHPEDANLCVPLAKLEEAAARQHRTLEQSVAGLQRGIGQWGNTRDPRVKAAFVMAEFSAVFDAKGLARIDRPVFLYYAQKNQVLLPRYNALHISPLVRKLTGLKMVRDAGHYVFLSPCTRELARSEPDLYTDPAGTDRTAVHRKIDADALKSFDRTLEVRSR